MKRETKAELERLLLLKKFKDEMLFEIEMMQKFFSLEEELKEAIENKKWHQLDRNVESLKEVSSRIEKIDIKRDEYFTALKRNLGLPPSSKFNDLVNEFPESIRNELFRIYRELKIGVIKVKSSTGRLSYIFRTLAESMNEVLGEIFPHRKGKIYSERGKEKQYSEESFVVNHEL